MHPIRALCAVVLAALLAFAAAVAHANDLGYAGDLTADLPGPDAEFQSLAAIHEGGLHFAYVAITEPQINQQDGDAGTLEALPLLFRYRLALEAAGWLVDAVGGGGNPFGSAGGAQLTAEHADGRYLRLNAGHPGVQHLDHAPSVATFVDGCVWPAEPRDDSCYPQRLIDEATTGSGSAASVGATELLAGIPEPTLSEYRSEEAIPEDGRHVHYIAAASHFALFGDYLKRLHDDGWTITDALTSGDLSAGSGSATATDGSRHLVFRVGGSGVLAHFDACVWPSVPADGHCPRSSLE